MILRRDGDLETRGVGETENAGERRRRDFSTGTHEQRRPAFRLGLFLQPEGELVQIPQPVVNDDLTGVDDRDHVRGDAGIRGSAGNLGQLEINPETGRDHETRSEEREKTRDQADIDDVDPIEAARMGAQAAGKIEGAGEQGKFRVEG